MAAQAAHARTENNELGSALGERDVRLLQLLDKLVIRERRSGPEPASDTDLRTVRAMLDGDEPDIVFQRIDNLAWGWAQGFEALARFRSEPRRPPDAWFACAHQAGVGQDLELKVAEAAIAAVPLLPERTSLTINMSASTLVSDAFGELMTSAPVHRVVVDVAEHEFVENYEAIAYTCGDLRAKGMSIAVDDAGSGFAGLAHLIRLAPDVIKLDTTITRGINRNVYAREMVASIVSLARFWKSHVVAEGIETEAELATLRRVGVDRGQGFLLGRPMPLADAIAACPEDER